MKLFLDNSLSQFLETKLGDFQKLVDNVNQHRFATETIPGIAQTIADRLEVGKLSINFESRKAETVMRVRNVADVFSQGGRGITKVNEAFVKYNFIVINGSHLLTMKPATRSMQYVVDFESTGQGFAFGYQTNSRVEDLSEELKQEAKVKMKPIIDELPLMQDAINKDIEAFNLSLLPPIVAALEQRKAIFDKRRQQDSDLNDF